MKGTIRIADREIGGTAPCYLIAELSANHNGSLQRALDSVRAAAAAGVDAVKLQTFKPDTMTIDAPGPEFTIGGEGPWAGRTLYDLYTEAHTPWEWHPAIFEEGRQCGIHVFSTPFDAQAVELLEELDAPAYKIASHELVDDGLLGIVAATGKPIILSSGMATMEEVVHALGVLSGSGASQVAVLHCTSSYPAPDSSMNLLTIPMLEQVTGCVVGLSDHSRGTTAAVAAVTLGARLIEKHFTLNREEGGVDSHFSLEPPELADLVRNVRRAEAMMGTAVVGPADAERTDLAFRRSIYAVHDIAPGETLTSDNIRSIRPGYGLAPRYLDIVRGRRAVMPIPKGTALRWDHVCASAAESHES